jgi:hypothetical protein
MENAVIGVEATSYLKTMSESIPAHEPLLAALGGEPISLTHYIDEELDRWKEHKMRPLFVFDGQPIVGENEMTLTNAKAALRKTQKAWDLYAENLATEAVKSFGASSTVSLHNCWQSLLTSHRGGSSPRCMRRP